MAVINIIHGDCMEAMKAMPDKAYGLAIVDDCYEIDLDYWTAATERLQRHKRQEVLPL